MNEARIVEKITEHDMHIDKLATAIEHMANTSININSKLDGIATAITEQNVLRERMNNLEANLRESFGRGNSRMDALDIRVISNEKLVDKIPTPVTMRWAIGIMIGYLILSGNYLVDHIHQLESSQASNEVKFEETKAQCFRRISKLEDGNE